MNEIKSKIESALEGNMSNSNGKINRCVFCTAPIINDYEVCLEDTFGLCEKCIEENKSNTSICTTNSKLPKKKICVYFEKGFCSKGNECSYLHSISNINKYESSSNRHFMNSRSRNYEMGTMREYRRVKNMSSKKKLTLVDGKFRDENGKIAPCHKKIVKGICPYDDDECWYSHEEICACNSIMDWCQHELEYGICKKNDCKFRHSNFKNPCTLDTCDFNQKITKSSQDAEISVEQSVDIAREEEKKKEEEKISQEETFFLVIG